MLGSKLLGEGEGKQMRFLTLILALLGGGTGLLASGLLVALHQPIVHVFTRDAQTQSLLGSPLWVLLCALQPINALVFVYDGLLYATQSFRYVRNALAVGVLLVFAPSLGIIVSLSHSLLGIWAAKALLNAWRCLTALLRIHVLLWPTWAGSNAAAAPTIEPLNAETVGVGRTTDASEYRSSDFTEVE